MDWHHPDGARCQEDDAARKRFVQSSSVRRVAANSGPIRPPSASASASSEAMSLAKSGSAPAITDLDSDPLKIISSGDWVKVDADKGIVEVTKRNRRGHK
jgi:hypothetical protein